MTSTTTVVAVAGTKREHSEMTSASTSIAAPPTAPVQEYSEDEHRKISKALARPLTALETQTKNKQAYLEGFRAWDITNDTFGFDGWSCSIRGFSPLSVSATRVKFKFLALKRFFPSVCKCPAANGKRQSLQQCVFLSRMVHFMRYVVSTLLGRPLSQVRCAQDVGVGASKNPQRSSAIENARKVFTML